MEPEVGMLMIVACGIEAVLNEETAVFHLLGLAAGEVSLSLLGDDIGYVAALGLEVVSHRLRLVFARTVFENRGLRQCAHRIINPGSIDRRTVEHHTYLAGIKLEVRILHRTVAVKIRIVLPEKHQ